MERTAPVFEGGSGAAHLRDEALEDLSNRFARPGVCHTDPNTVGSQQRGGAGSVLMVMGIKSQDRQDFPRAQANTAIEHPEEAVGKGGLPQRDAPQGAGRVEAHDGESDDPIDHSLRARRFGDAQGHGQESEDTRDGAKANTSDAKELESHVNHIDLGHGDESMQVGLDLTQAGLRRCEGSGDTVAFRLETSALFALVALALAALRRLVFPLISTVVQCGELAHHVYPGALHGPRPWSGVEVRRKMPP